jgi:hypothetical protein
MLQSQTLHIIGRIPVGPAGFFAAWLIGWTAGGLMAASANLPRGVAFLLIGWLLVGAVIGWSLVLELRRFRRAQDALVAQLGGPSA